jgi:hypothetical protein
MEVTIIFWLYCLVISLICIFIFAACRLAGDAEEALERIMATQAIEACAPATDIEDLCILSGAEGWTEPKMARKREAS